MSEPKKNIEQYYSIIDRRSEDLEWNKDKYTKFLVTIALRLGYAIKDDGKPIQLYFSGELSEYNRSHNSHNYIGTLNINDNKVFGKIKICTHNEGKKIATLWPIHDDDDLNQQAKDNKTKDFIKYYIEGARDFTIEEIADWYHPVFKDYPGYSPLEMEKEVNYKQMKVLKAQHEHECKRLIGEKKTVEESLAISEEENKSLKIQLASTHRKPDQSTIAHKRPKKILTGVEKIKIFRKSANSEVPGVKIHFDDGSFLLNNWDQATERYNTLSKLVGKEVITDTWGSYSDEEWFANVYLAEIG